MCLTTGTYQGIGGFFTLSSHIILLKFSFVCSLYLFTLCKLKGIIEAVAES